MRPAGFNLKAVEQGSRVQSIRAAIWRGDVALRQASVYQALNSPAIPSARRRIFTPQELAM